MGALGSERDLAKAGYTSVGEDSLTDNDRLKILRPHRWDNLSLEKQLECLLSEFDTVTLKEAEDSLKTDKTIESAETDWLESRNSVFTVLGQQSTPIITKDQSIIDKADARKAKQKAKEIEHQKKMENDSEYANKWKMREEMMLALLSGEPGSGEKPFFF